jgi:hypothetical protein
MVMDDQTISDNIRSILKDVSDYELQFKSLIEYIKALKNDGYSQDHVYILFRTIFYDDNNTEDNIDNLYDALCVISGWCNKRSEIWNGTGIQDINAENEQTNKYVYIFDKKTSEILKKTVIE